MQPFHTCSTLATKYRICYHKVYLQEIPGTCDLVFLLPRMLDHQGLIFLQAQSHLHLFRMQIKLFPKLCSVLESMPLCRNGQGFPLHQRRRQHHHQGRGGLERHRYLQVRFAEMVILFHINTQAQTSSQISLIQIQFH